METLGRRGGVAKGQSAWTLGPPEPLLCAGPWLAGGPDGESDGQGNAERCVLGWWAAQDLLEPRPQGGAQRACGGRLWEVLPAERAGREEEAFHRELALARVRARAGQGRLERGKGLSSGSRRGSGLFNLCCRPLGLGQLGSGMTVVRAEDSGEQPGSHFDVTLGLGF